MPPTVPVTVPFVRPAPWPALRPGRFASRIVQGAQPGCDVVLLGLPDDLGVRLNGGRAGAAAGPAAFRAALAAYGSTYDLTAAADLDVKVCDAGDVEPAPGDDEAALLATHARVAAAVTALDQLGGVVFCIGGGHDLALPSVAAIAQRRQVVLGGINVDAHLDVREKVGSGMPFRRLITGGHLDPRAFVELGLGRFANDRADADWLRAQGAALVTADEVREQGFSAPVLLEHALQGGAGFLSVDLDGIDGAAAPGVSAPAPAGLDVHHVARLAEAAGRDPRLLHAGILELCPPHDFESRTARVAAHLFLCFLAGVTGPAGRRGTPGTPAAPGPP